MSYCLHAAIQQPILTPVYAMLSNIKPIILQCCLFQLSFSLRILEWNDVQARNLALVTPVAYGDDDDEDEDEDGDDDDDDDADDDDDDDDYYDDGGVDYDQKYAATAHSAGPTQTWPRHTFSEPPFSS